MFYDRDKFISHTAHGGCWRHLAKTICICVCVIGRFSFEYFTIFTVRMDGCVRVSEWIEKTALHFSFVLFYNNNKCPWSGLIEQISFLPRSRSYLHFYFHLAYVCVWMCVYGWMCAFACVFVQWIAVCCGRNYMLIMSVCKESLQIETTKKKK